MNPLMKSEAEVLRETGPRIIRSDKIFPHHVCVVTDPITKPDDPLLENIYDRYDLSADDIVLLVNDSRTYLYAKTQKAVDAFRNNK